MLDRTDSSCERWALGEFGQADLGDERRTRRVVAMAAQCARSPGSLVTKVFPTSAARQGAYKLLEYGRVEREKLVEAASQAAFRKAEGPFVVGVADGCTLSLAAASRSSGFGRVGSGGEGSFGAESLHAILLNREGTPLGLGAQVMWVRTGPKRPRGTDTRGLPLEEKETRYWLQVGEETLEAAQAAGYRGRVWMQFDAGADARDVLTWGAWTPHLWLTVRCGHPRTALWPEERDLWDLMRAQPVLGRYPLQVRPTPKRAGRRAKLEVRAGPVVLQLRNPANSQTEAVPLHAVYVREVGTCPHREEPIEWLLLTTRKVEGFRGAREVIRLYALRWRVEEVHRTWKAGACGVERSGLSYAAFQNWAVLLLCVAVRIERLKRLSREQPDLLARTEFSSAELKMLVLLRKETAATQKELETLTLDQAVEWLAQIGGYTYHSPSRGPPGSITLNRGLTTLTDALRIQKILARQK